MEEEEEAPAVEEEEAPAVEGDVEAPAVEEEEAKPNVEADVADVAATPASRLGVGEADAPPSGLLGDATAAASTPCAAP